MAWPTAVAPLIAPASRNDPSALLRLERRLRFYTALLLLTVLVMASFALPVKLRLFGSLGYSLTLLLLVLALGGPIRHAGRPCLGNLLYRLLGLTALVVQGLWSFAPAGAQRSGLPLLVMVTVFIAWSVLRLLALLALEPTVERRVLMGAVAGYLLLGLTAGLLMTILETIVPGSFTAVDDATQVLGPITSAEVQQRMWQLDFVRLNYFAFVCLTTVGFGDIAPQTPQAQMITVTFTVIGPTYMALVLGLLINRSNSAEAQEVAAALKQLKAGGPPSP
jgi:voltage-gated potassium channel